MVSVLSAKRKITPTNLLSNSSFSVKDSTDTILKNAPSGSRLHQHPEWLKSQNLSHWIQSYERREAVYPEQLLNDECLRLIHKEGTPLRMDKLGKVAVMGWWDAHGPTENDWRDIDTFLSITHLEHWVFRHYSGKPEKDSDKSFSIGAPETWQGTENHIAFEFRRNQGVSAGLFLDQRDHRQWLRTQSSGKKMLNLFAYTGGFSVYSAMGGAAHTTTVDLSPKYIEWSRKNFSLNNLSLDPANAKFYSMDSMDYLKYAKRHSLTFDLIICDPPSYSRNKGGDFRIDRDFPHLINAMANILAPSGTIFFSTNYENWDLKTWTRELEKVCKTRQLSIHQRTNPAQDFELRPSETLMKAFHIKN
jgi:23S rRNA (cytosine1962-C5)-methyltransferase